jgi:flagellar biosynthesis GTPase FlhF
VPELYREATKPHTTLVYDILDCVRQYGTVTYERLMEETGAAYRTVREHVTRLCDEVGGNEPGILEKVQDAVTFIAFSSRFFEDHADEALDQVLPDDTPEQRQQRAEERRERREQRQAHHDEESEGTTADDAQAAERSDERSTWRYFDQIALTPEQLADALDEEFLPTDHVRVRVDASPLFGCG